MHAREGQFPIPRRGLIGCLLKILKEVLLLFSEFRVEYAATQRLITPPVTRTATE